MSSNSGQFHWIILYSLFLPFPSFLPSHNSHYSNIRDSDSCSNFIFFLSHFVLLSTHKLCFSTLRWDFISNLIVFLSCFIDLASLPTSLKPLSNSFVFVSIFTCFVNGVNFTYLVSISPKLVNSFGMVFGSHIRGFPIMLRDLWPPNHLRVGSKKNTEALCDRSDWLWTLAGVGIFLGGNSLSWYLQLFSLRLVTISREESSKLLTEKL